MTDLLTVGPFVASPTGLTIKGRVSLREWASYVQGVSGIHTRVQWVLADLLLYGEENFGDSAYEVLSECTRFSIGTLRNFRWVGSRFPPEDRDSELSFYEHQEVARLETREQRQDMLWRIHDEGLSQHEIREQVGELKALSAGEEAGTWGVILMRPPLSSLDWDNFRRSRPPLANNALVILFARPQYSQLIFSVFDAWQMRIPTCSVWVPGSGGVRGKLSFEAHRHIWYGTTGTVVPMTDDLPLSVYKQSRFSDMVDQIWEEVDAQFPDKSKAAAWLRPMDGFANLMYRKGWEVR